MPTVDLLALLALLLFAVWGALKGSLRQLASLVVLFVAFPVATRFGPRVEGSVVKAVSATGDDLRLVSWTVVFVATLVAGGALIALFHPLFARLRHGERGLGALFGVVHGVAVLTVVVYVLLVAFPARPPAIVALRESHAMVAARTIRGWAAPALVLPPWMRARLDAADGDIRSTG